MTPIVNSTVTHLNQLKQVLQLLSKDQYAENLALLGNSSIGKHTRHIIEFYTCLLNGIPIKSVNYDKRERNLELETSLAFSLEKLESIRDTVSSIDSDSRLWLNFEYGENAGVVDSSLHRELVYNIEHTVHHLAIIRIAISHYYSAITLPAEIGFASSTIKHLQYA